jgi:predicted DNA-binding protein
MPSGTVRISLETQEKLRAIASRTGLTMQAVLDEAIEAYRRERFLAAANRAYSTLRKDPKRWQAEQDERAGWDAALSDGLEDV